MTGIPMDVWEDAGPRAVATAWDVIEQAKPKGGSNG